ncbi:C-type lectin domain family 12 member B-like isoform X2 [Pseudochaenichthys georgianus]|uniref:C-type lectin domain family 12 member B-like isoform X2 n=1 Tax=Pseudochaenichthys georgianus TaxID=52239 RepID=UPI00146B66FC|nr:C-type lectin domain family 12 member B-like isoform X2 [Pseudochaenichthys georgianus]XP_033957995.1 C-type lectin domain family 12 member B-like isoform X2 [Pseudochaenichthys georgianus]
MAEREEEVNYASGVFKAGNNPPPADSAGRRRFQHLACCLGILCVILLGGIIGVCVYLQVLSKLNQELETQKNNLTQQIQNMETNRNELNITQAQWSIDSYCLGNTDKKWQPCQKGWNLTAPSCYAFNDAPSSGWKTWEEAREDCKGNNSDLAVAHNPAEKEAIKTNSFGVYGFWIGLRVVNKEWKWVDGSDLTESSWIAAPDPADGRCAVFYKGKWVSVSCGATRQWICQKKALSV